MEVKFFGSKRDVDFAKNIFKVEDLLGNEPVDRLVLQDAIDQFGIKARVLYDGNYVWSFNRTIRDFKRYMKSGHMTMNLYRFFSLACGSIAHFDLNGWQLVHPPEDMKAFFTRNEYGYRVLNDIPGWKTDAKKIVKEIERILGI